MMSNIIYTKHIITTVILLLFFMFAGCELFVTSGEQLQNEEEETIGVCSADLFDFVDEHESIRIVIDLVMEDYEPRSQLDADEWEEQREEIIELQNEFLEKLEDNDLNISAVNKGSRPWLALGVEEPELRFICKHDMVDTLQRDKPESPQ